jgi:BASS family bile acid:Na+ symporter
VGAIDRLLHWTKGRLLWLLLGTYVLGAIAPGAGLALRSVDVHSFAWFDGSPVTLSLPMLMLGILLVVAGLGTKAEELRHLLRRPGILVVGLAANLVFPILFTLLAASLLSVWHNTDELQSILVALAIIGAMPIAGSSTAWSQNAGGSLALSLGLVLASTLLSPLLTPIGLHAVGSMTQGHYSADLHELAREGSTPFVILAVVAPSVLGVLLRVMLGSKRSERILPALRLLNLLNLLLLNYTNAAVALPEAVRNPDWDFLALALALTSGLCLGAFALGWLLARVLRTDHAHQTAMMFGLGMSNNGSGLVLAATSLSSHPLVLVPIILHNVVQQIVAGICDRFRRSSAGVCSP